MSFVKHVALASALIAGFGLAVSANASEAKSSDCVQMAKQVSAAIEAAQPGQTVDQARGLAKNARSFCSGNMYGRGVDLYSKALTLLNNKS